MKMSFRWYGESDPISLEYISQIPGMHSIVSAVYDVKPGEVWPEESLAKMKAQCEAHGLVFDVVESIPVHEDIKLGRNNVDELLDVYCENIRRCAKYGVKCVTYNFMPVFDWTRTQLDKKAPDGSTSLVMYWDQMNGLDPLKDDIHLPGWDSSYSQEEVRELINAYGAIGEEGLWKNLEKFLKNEGQSRGRGVRRCDGHSSGRPTLSHLRPAPHHHLRGKPGPLPGSGGQPRQQPVPVHRKPGLRQIQRRGQDGAQIQRHGPHRFHAHPQRQDHGRRQL